MLVGNRFHDLGTSKGMARKHMTNQAAILMLVAASAAAQDICEKGGWVWHDVPAVRVGVDVAECTWFPLVGVTVREGCGGVGMLIDHHGSCLSLGRARCFGARRCCEGTHQRKTRVKKGGGTGHYALIRAILQQYNTRHASLLPSSSKRASAPSCTCLASCGCSSAWESSPTSS